MRSAATLLLAALAAAAPHAQPSGGASSSLSVADPTVSVPLSTSLNVPTTLPTLLPTQTAPGNRSTSRTTSRHHFSHWEPLPIFSKSCDCPDLATVRYPCWATDSLQRCNFEELHSWVCWTSAARGCPTPTRKCDALYAPTPVTGRHPCELGRNTMGLGPGTSRITGAPDVPARPSVTAAPLAGYGVEARTL